MISSIYPLPSDLASATFFTLSETWGRAPGATLGFYWEPLTPHVSALHIEYPPSTPNESVQENAMNLARAAAGYEQAHPKTRRYLQSYRTSMTPAQAERISEGAARILSLLQRP